MDRTDTLICPNCDYKRHLSEAESGISGAMIVACLKCGTAMQCCTRKPANTSPRQRAFPPCDSTKAQDDRAMR